MARVCAELRRARPLLGTFVEIGVSGAGEAELASAVDAAFASVASVHDLMSFHRHDSDVSRLNREAGLRPIQVHPWTFQVLSTAAELNLRSNGVFDVAIAPHLQRLGLLPGIDEIGAPAVDAPLVEAIELLPGGQVRYRQVGVRIDLGGIAKGFAVDRAIEVLRGFGVTSAVVNAGGDLAAFGPRPHTIHIRHPREPSRLVCSVRIADAALASSARRFDPYQNDRTSGTAIIDPSTGKPPHLVDSASVRAQSCMMADALAKIVMIRGTEAGDLLEHYHARALMISRDGNIQISSDWHRDVHLAA